MSEFSFKKATRETWKNYFSPIRDAKIWAKENPYSALGIIFILYIGFWLYQQAEQSEREAKVITKMHYPSEAKLPPEATKNGIKMPVLGKNTFKTDYLLNALGHPQQASIILMINLNDENSYHLEEALGQNIEQIEDQGIKLAFEPVSGIKRWDYNAKVYYALNEMNHLKLIPKVYTDIINNEVTLNSDADVIEYLSSLGAPRQEIEKLINSTVLAKHMARSKTLTQLSELENTPALIINNQYRISLEGAGSIHNAIRMAVLLAKSQPLR